MTSTDPGEPQLFGALEPDRAILRVSGADAESFLQGLFSNDVTRASVREAVYAALLTPQGKFLFDAFIHRPDPKQFLLDVAAGDIEPLQKRLTMYKLRAQVEIARAAAYKTLLLWPSADAPEPGAQLNEDAALLTETARAARPLGLTTIDPRAEGLGLRILVESRRAAEAENLAPLGAAPGELSHYNARRVRLGVPVAGDDIVREQTFPLEIGFDRIGGVDFRKGCYVGQEVSARMKHKAVLKKALYFVDLSSADAASPGDALNLADRPAGELGSVEGALGLALLRIDRAEGELSLESGGSARVIAPVFASPSEAGDNV